MSRVNIKAAIEQVDLVEYAEKYTALSESGSQYRGICPICKHGNETEFVVYNHKSFYCFVCGAWGDVISLIRGVEQVDFFTAVEKLAEELNIDIARDEDYARRKTLSMQYKAHAEKCHRNVKVVEDYLMKTRGLTAETIEEFQLGATEKGDVVIPYVDENDRNVGVALRRFEGNPKYKNNKNNELFTKSAFLYNLRGAKKKLKNELYLVEGYFCAMTLHQAGYAAAAYNSSTVTRQQCDVLSKLYRMHPELTVILIPDNDGVAFPLVSKTRKNFKSNAPDIPVLVMKLPDGVKDVNELLTSGRLCEFEELPCVELDQWVLYFELKKCATRDAERKVTAKYIRDVRDPITTDEIASYLAVRWHVDKKVVADFLMISRENRNICDDFKRAEECYEETMLMLLDTRLEYGITALDEGLRGGGRRKDVTFIGASAGAGKTFLTVQMCVDMVVRQRKNAIYFSMEMSAGALYERVLSNLLGVSTEKVDELICYGDQSVLKLLEKLKDHLYVVDKNGLTINQVDAYVKEANAKLFEGSLDVVFIDYIQYMKNCAEYQVLAETAKGMKPLAKDNNIHVVVISQLNRGSKTWEKPNLGDLKGGGDLEASADNAFLMWRPGSSPVLSPDEKERIKNDVMLYVAKARNGEKVKDLCLTIDPLTSRMKLKGG